MRPVFQDEKDGKWYFWNEVWTDSYGPYDTQAEAQHGMELYFKEMGGRCTNG